MRVPRTAALSGVCDHRRAISATRLYTHYTPRKAAVRGTRKSQADVALMLINHHHIVIDPPLETFDLARVVGHGKDIGG